MSGIQGLTSAQALRFRDEDGPNVIEDKSHRSALSILIRQFTSPAIVVLLISGCIYGALGNLHDAAILLAIIIPSGLITFFQEYRAHITITQLQIRLATYVHVFRDGVEVSLPLEELVRGDVVRLAPGDLVPADLLLIGDSALQVDESVLTGESFPRHKSSKAGDELYMGTHIVGGGALARVIRTGSRTKYGELAERISGHNLQTSFERGVRNFGYLVARYVFILVTFVFIGNIILKRPIFESLLFSLALAVGLTPQMLPVIISVCLSTGARKLAREKVLVKRLDAIEDLGTLDCLCTDKTGTLTTGKLEVLRAVDPDGMDSERVARLAFENAFLQSSSSNSIDDAILRSKPIAITRSKIGEIDFNFERRRVSIITNDRELICKGAFTEVIAQSTSVRLRDHIEPIAQHKERLFEMNRNSAENGLKIIALASKENVVYPSEDLEKNLIFEGMILISDPPKVGAKESLRELQELGIEVFLLTGDNAVTAGRIAREVGISTENVARGEDIQVLEDHDLEKLLSKNRVLAEVDPLQKLRVVQVLQGNGRVVGFLGDGINDAAALRIADVAISVDDAVDVAKSASSIILLEKELAVLSDGVRLGRRTFINTMKYIRISISALFGNMVSVAIASYFLPYLPMLPTQILLLNFFNDLPAIAIAADRVDDEELVTPQRWTLREIGHFMVFFGIISTAFDLLVFVGCVAIFHASPEELRSTWFAESAMTAVVAIWVLRTKRFSWRSRPSIGLVAIGTAVIIISLLVPFAGIFHFMGLPKVAPHFTFFAVGLVLTYAIANEIAKKMRRSLV